MKFTLFDCVYDTRIYNENEIEQMMQDRLDAWLGSGTVKVAVSLLRLKTMKVTLWRKYGSWYKESDIIWYPFTSNCDVDIFSYDMEIFLGSGYTTGTGADLSKHDGRFLNWYDVKGFFLPDMKEMAKRHHGSRVKRVEVDSDIEHVDLTIELV